MKHHLRVLALAASGGPMLQAPIPPQDGTCGTVISSFSGQPVSDAVVYLSQGREQVSDVTGPDGRFCVAEEFDRGAVEVRVYDALNPRIDPITSQTVLVAGDDTELAISVRAGPHYSYELALPDGYDESKFEACTTPRSPGYCFEPKIGNVAPLVSRDGHYESRMRPWSLETEACSSSHLLMVRSLDGKWLGGAWLSDRPYPSRNVVQLSVEPCSILVGRVLDASGQPVHGARLVVRPQKLSQSRLHTFPRFDFTKDDGSYRVPWLPAGQYRVAAFHPRRGASTGYQLRVPGGEGDTVMQDVRLAPAEWAALGGHLAVDEWPRYQTVGTFELTSTSNPDLRYETTISAGQSELRFGRILPGEYELRALAP